MINRGQKPFGPIREAGLYTDERPRRVLTAFLLAAVASMWQRPGSASAAVARFDTGRGPSAAQRGTHWDGSEPVAAVGRYESDRRSKRDRVV